MASPPSGTAAPDLTGVELTHVRERIITCVRCPRLRTYCARVAREKKPEHRDDVYWGRPVPGFGDPKARILVLGLAPAAHGANRTGRVFTGDGSGDFLMRAMHAAGFASIPTSRRADDGLELHGAYIVAAARCAPPANKPTPEELRSCFTHLQREIAALPELRVLVALGHIASDTYWRLLTHDGGPLPKPRPRFGHGHVFMPESPATGGRRPLVLVDSYHPSRQNTNTGKLTASMLEDVFRKASALARTSP